MKYRWSRGLLGVVLLVSSQIASAADQTTGDDGLRPLITTSELVVGPNRFAFGLLKAGKLLEAADLRLRLYAIEKQPAQLAAELIPTYQRIEIRGRKSAVHRHADGTRHVHGSADSEVRGIYVTQLNFSRAGNWGIELLLRPPDGLAETARFTVRVLDAPATPAPGSAAPPSRNLIASDVTDLRRIDTSQPPDVRLHRVRIADAIAQRKPQVIVFATPQFCTSRMCGPVVDVVKTLLPAYGKRIAFIHQEIWEDFALKKPFRTVEEWGLHTEPWIFVVDGQGVIRARFEGLVTRGEIESALQVVLQTQPSRRR